MHSTTQYMPTHLLLVLLGVQMKQKLQAREVLQTWSNLNLEEKYDIYTHTAQKLKNK